MPSCKLALTNGFCLLDVLVSTYSSQPNLNLTENKFKALIDTGASVTCLSQAVVDRLGLISIVKSSMQSASHVVDVDVFNIHICILIVTHTAKDESSLSIDINSMCPHL